MRKTASVYNPGADSPRVTGAHGFLAAKAGDLPLGTRLRFIPADVCTVMNLASKVNLVRGEEALDTWTIDACGRSD